MSHLGEDHPYTRRCLINLEEVGADLKRIDDAGGWSWQMFGSGGMDTFKSYVTLGNPKEAKAEDLMKSGKYAEAKAMYREAMQDMDDGEDTTKILHRIAYCLYRQDKMIESEKLHREALEATKSKYGDGHHQTLSSILFLANQVNERGDGASEAVSLFSDALRGMRALQNGHPRMLECMYNLATVLMAQGEGEKAEALYREAIDIGGKQGNVQEIVILHDCMNNLGEILLHRGNIGEASQLLRMVVPQRTFLHGNDHPSTLGSKYLLARCYTACKMFGAAEHLLRDVLSGYVRQFGKSHELSQHANDLLVRALMNQKKFTEAEAYAEENLRVRRSLYGKDDRETLVSVFNLGQACAGQGKTAIAVKLFREAFELLTQQGLHDDVLTLDCKRRLDDLESSNKK